MAQPDRVGSEIETTIKNKNTMGFFSKIFSATVKTVLTPVAIVKDVVNVATGEEPDATKNLIESAVEDTKEAIDDMGDADML